MTRKKRKGNYTKCDCCERIAYLTTEGWYLCTNESCKWVIKK